MGQDMVEVRAKCEMAKTIIKNRGYEPVSPLEVHPDINARYSTLLGHCIEAVLNCTGVLFLEGWAESKGCLLEKSCAEIYGIKMYFGIDNLPPNVKTIKTGILKE